MPDLDKFITALKSLVRDPSNYWPSETKNLGPHKPFLLLSILDGIDQGWITNNQITLSQNLKDTFFIYWDEIIGKERRTKVRIPFKHLGGEPFDSYWNLVDNKNATIDADIFDKLLEKSFRLKIRHLLMKEYFSPEASVIIAELSETNRDAWKYTHELDNLVNTPFKTYHEEKKKNRLVNDQARAAGFLIKIREIYDNTCAICKSRVVTPYGRTLVESAHIIPWSESYNDDPRNGISLCRNHHWLFDKYLIAIRVDYSVEISPFLLNNSEIGIEIDSIKDEIIHLPDKSDYHPAKEAILDHKSRFNTFYD